MAEFMGDKFGQQRPPLSIFIKKILERYPDGQIFKEMIQNADDAGAKTVQFFIDHQHHGTSSLPHPDLAKFQGPSLMSANDACFSEEDWKGIQKLEQSIKADDPFKVGRFGIGFNAVYHVTDVPIIVSGERVGYLDPQEKIWPKESGKSFRLSDLQKHGGDALAPLNGVADFCSSGAASYTKTLFRFPLRTAPSDLSGNVYSTEMLVELVDALRKDAKLLLPFLRSVTKIEVYNIPDTGVQQLYFKVAISSSSKSRDLVKKRKLFMRRLKKAHECQPYCITSPIEFVANFQIEVCDPSSSENSSSNWLVANVVGSSAPEVVVAARKQRVFPWVGAGIEIDNHRESGRIFCFLPVPIETVSGYPVHVNGTFSLNDDRRSLKWPGIERKNDPAAKWNDLLVTELLPYCYSLLLLESKQHLNLDHFYSMWPDVSAIKSPHWAKVLLPLFEDMFEKQVVWSERTEALQKVGEWVSVSEAVFVSKSTASLPSVVHRVLSRCGIKLVTIPLRIWSAIQCVKVSVQQVTPKLARGQLRSKPFSYNTVDSIGKCELLRYCLSDGQYNEVRGLELLPLANGTFITFQQGKPSIQKVYMCTQEYPRYLLPNSDDKLVDIAHDPDLDTKLRAVAKSNTTQLALMTDELFANVLSLAMPSEWKKVSVVCLPVLGFSLEWLKRLWVWLEHRNLSLFKGKCILPISVKDMEPTTCHVMKLKTGQPHVYIPMHVTCSTSLLAALTKLHVLYTLEQDFPYVRHHQLKKILYPFNTNGVLDAISQTSSYHSVTFTEDEAASLQEFISPSAYSPSKTRLMVLNGLQIFKTAANCCGRLTSMQQIKAQSVLKQPLVEPVRCSYSVTNLPSSIILLSQTNAFQKQLLRLLNTKLVGDAELLLGFVFPLIRNKSFPSHLLKSLMVQVLDMFQSLQHDNPEICNALASLPFIDAGSGQTKCPQDLYDPSNSQLVDLFAGENVFPLCPYNTPTCVAVLRQCKLKVKVGPQEVLAIIHKISLPVGSQAMPVDQKRLKRAKAVLKYISSFEFLRNISGNYTLPSRTGYFSFHRALDCLFRERCCIPVMATPPSGYPAILPWKGAGCKSHFACLGSSNVILSTTNSTINPLIVGSQMYTSDPVIPNAITDHLVKDSNIVPFVICHLKEIVSLTRKIPSDSLSKIVILVYEFLAHEWEKDTSLQEFKQLHSLSEWVYIRKQHRFVSPQVIALKHNSTFRQNLEPFLWILPDDLMVFSSFFAAFGVRKLITKEQVVSTLRMIHDTISSGDFYLEPHEAWGIVMNILNWITLDGTIKAANFPDNDLYVPIDAEDQLPKLCKASDVVYTDNDFLRSFLQSSDLENEQFTFVHNRVNPKLAANLGLTPLSEYLEISEDTFEDSGQHEPLTSRLKTILKDYKDGLTIIKELLQNADDAEATEVNICYDSRSHSVSKNNLFFPGMLDSHGPALVVHNNKPFANEDFKNITRLGGATKLNKPLKIGKFGIGFCSVYHITDVPSFVSQDSLCIFDPTLSYLRKEIKNPSQPGKKVKFTSKFIAKSAQLAPYAGLYNFKSSELYGETIFRFPFRKCHTELSSTCYSDATVQELIEDIKKSGIKLLLFLQHVNCITFERINPGDETPTLLLEITKERDRHFILQNSSAQLYKLQCKDLSTDTCQTEYWLIATNTTPIRGKLAVASVSCRLNAGSLGFTVSKVDGEVFCFLPISLKTGLPVHVNSNFAVINNRRGIWTADEATSKADIEVLWNKSLMQTVIPQAYFCILTSLQCMHQDSQLLDYCFYSLWPLCNKLTQQNPWSSLVDTLYEKVSSAKLFYSPNTKTWLCLPESKFLQQDILCCSSGDRLQIPECVPEVLRQLKLSVVELPDDYCIHLDILDYTITDIDFINLFFKNFQNLDKITKYRNEAILCLLEMYATESDDNTAKSKLLKRHFMSSACIPCTPDGSKMRKIDDVVDPKAPFAQLFDESESYFPIELLTSRHLATSAMHFLGMISKKLPWRLVIERAHMSARLYDSNERTKALEYVKLILETLESHMDSYIPSEEFNVYDIKFLPVVTKPIGYPVNWHGDTHSLLSGKELMTAGTLAETVSIAGNVKMGTNIIIAGSQCSILCEASPQNGGCGNVSYFTREILKIRHSPTVGQVVQHLIEFINVFNSQPATYEMIEWADHICRKAYSFLNSRLSTSQTVDVNAHVSDLLQLPCVWTGNQFIEAKIIARQWTHNGPYLYPIPSCMSDKPHLLSLLEIKDEFTQVDVKGVLLQLHNDFGDQPLDDSCKGIIEELLPLLMKIVPKEFSDFKIMLPDENFVMRWSSQLSYNDAEWAPKDKDYQYINDIFSRSLARQLHVKPVRSKLADKFLTSKDTHFSGDPFGQREELTRRIQNILRDYPFDITVLKELLQNADDAKAKKMYIILDARNHGTQSVLSENWQHLQGPALLVWNDSVFSERDLKGIQELGLGSKRSEAESIGQYGIGFNVVYHLTDCPSFISGGETLCVMDPHCRYVEGADPLSPGRRYDDLSEKGFWHQFPDMRSIFLRDGLDNCPEELLSGSLFRFPLRCTEELVSLSRISEEQETPLTASDLHKKLHDWAPKMKEAMFFLNNINELRFIVIQKSSNHMVVENHYCTHVDDSAQNNRALLYAKLAAFNQQRGSNSCIIRYPLTLTDIQHSGTDKETKEEEQWLIQQRVGDIDNSKTFWQYVKTVKPRHGIAAPLSIPRKSVNYGSLSAIGKQLEFNGKIFCFLPLPVESKLPVHLNGHFILHSNRRDLWHSTDPEQYDDRSKWNCYLLEAISSSYANLLVHSRTYYLSCKEYPSWTRFFESIDKYYNIFPRASPEKLDKVWLELAKNVYSKLFHANSLVLAVPKKTPSPNVNNDVICIEWYPPMSSVKSSQVYFFPHDSDRKMLKPILEDIGMKITSAPFRVRTHLNQAVKQECDMIPQITPKSVFLYYIQFSRQVSSQGFPVNIEQTAFKTVDAFKIFTEYLLCSPSVWQSSKTFPSTPFGHPLLLTADCKLRTLSNHEKVLCSQFSYLFMDSLEYFLHPDLLSIEYATYCILY